MPAYLEATEELSFALEITTLERPRLGSSIHCVISRMNKLRYEEKWKKYINHDATIQAETGGINMPKIIPGQARCRNVTAKFKYCSTSANEEHQPQTLEEYYRGTMSFNFWIPWFRNSTGDFKGKRKLTKSCITWFNAGLSPALSRWSGYKSIFQK